MYTTWIINGFSCKTGNGVVHVAENCVIFLLVCIGWNLRKLLRLVMGPLTYKAFPIELVFHM